MFNMSTITVREVDEETFREFKAEAAKRGISLGTALTLAMEKFRKEVGSKKMKLSSLQPIHWGLAHVSENMDDILYGEK